MYGLRILLPRTVLWFSICVQHISHLTSAEFLLTFGTVCKVSNLYIIFGTVRKVSNLYIILKFKLGNAVTSFLHPIAMLRTFFLCPENISTFFYKFKIFKSL